MSALALMSLGRHKYLKIKPGDTVVFSSRFIPGNEKAINQIINDFGRRGARVMYEKVSDVHVSGHASEEELRYLIRLVRPTYFVPIHGEYRHLLRHADIAMDEGMARDHVLVAVNGDLIEIGPDGVMVREQLETGRVFVHGKGVGDIGHDVLRDRKSLSETGIVMVSLAVSVHTGCLVAGPKLDSIGVTFEEVEQELLDKVAEAVQERLRDLSPCTPSQWEDAKEEIRLAVRRGINRILGRKPLVKTVILQV
jgi:ribonuclease J